MPCTCLYKRAFVSRIGALALHGVSWIDGIREVRKDGLIKLYRAKRDIRYKPDLCLACAYIKSLPYLDRGASGADYAIL